MQSPLCWPAPIKIGAVRRLFRCIGATKQASLLHFVVQCDRVPIVPVRPGQRAILDKDTREIRRILERFSHSLSLLRDVRKIAYSNGGIGKLNFQLIAAERANTDNFYHHSGPPGETICSIAAAMERRRRSVPCAPNSIRPTGASPAR